VVLALALLVVGGIALVNALTSSGASEPNAVQTEEGPAGSAGESAAPSPQQSSPAQSASRSNTRLPLLVRVTGAPTQVIVRVAGGGEVLQQGVLNTGEFRQYQQAPLTVVATNGGAVEVTIYGDRQDPEPAGKRAEWFVPER
jgi:hypothetical protein